MSKKYYFITYCFYREQKLLYENEIIDINPMEWIIKYRDDPEHYTLISFQQITKQEFEQFKAELNYEFS